MKTKLFFILIASLFFSLTVMSGKDAIIIDHNCTKLSNVPTENIVSAKNNFRLAYGHTSHGSQIVTGMSLLKGESALYAYNSGNGSLYLNDASLLPGDLGNPDRSTWAAKTRQVLDNNSQNINLIMWSWCGQVDGTESNINTYLNLMDQLEKDYPSIVFIYMTGHLNGTGVNGNVNKRNEQIRAFCRENGKVLFDFADIESYDPDGKYFLDKGADDGCNYSGGNWADEWCDANPTLCNTGCSCAHSKCLNCQQKGKAFWWMMARLDGWEGEVQSVSSSILSEFSISPNPASDYIEITLPNVIQSEAKNPVIKVYDVFGQVVNLTPTLSMLGEGGSTPFNSPAGGGHLRIDVSMLPAGVYFVRVGGKVAKFLKI